MNHNHPCHSMSHKRTHTHTLFAESKNDTRGAVLWSKKNHNKVICTSCWCSYLAYKAKLVNKNNDHLGILILASCLHLSCLDITYHSQDQVNMFDRHSLISHKSGTLLFSWISSELLGTNGKLWMAGHKSRTINILWSGIMQTPRKCWVLVLHCTRSRFKISHVHQPD